MTAEYRRASKPVMCLAGIGLTIVFGLHPAWSAASAAPRSDPGLRLAPWPGGARSPDFELVDFDGRPRALADYRGRVVVVFFGFLHCPDVCPAELLKLELSMQQLGALRDKVQVLFITLDPERDTPPMLKSYVREFDPRFVGLTGTSAAIDRAAANFHVQYARVALGTDYTIDHSTATYVLDGAGRLRLLGGSGTSAADYTHDIKALLRDGP